MIVEEFEKDAGRRRVGDSEEIGQLRFVQVHRLDGHRLRVMIIDDILAFGHVRAQFGELEIRMDAKSSSA